MPSGSRLEEYLDPEAAARYDQRWAGARGLRRDARKRAALLRGLEWLQRNGRLGLTPQELLVDVPCGTGRFAELWRSHWKGRILGLDGSPAMLGEAKAGGWPGLLAVADAGSLPLDGWDVAVCVRFLHLVRDPRDRRRFLEELARGTRGGVLLDVRHGSTPRGLGRAIRRVLARWRGHSGPRAWPSPGAWEAEFREAGLMVLQRLPVRRIPWLSDKIVYVLEPRAAGSRPKGA